MKLPGLAAAVSLFIAAALLSPVQADGPGTGGVREIHHFADVFAEDRTYVAVLNVPGVTADDLANASVDLSSDNATRAYFQPTKIVIQRSEAVTDTTLDDLQTTMVFTCIECVLIGELEDWPNLIVSEGTLQVDHFNTAYWTRHITVTVTISLAPGDCGPAAPAVATRYLREHYGLPANAVTAGGENIVSKVGRHMGPGATFNDIDRCDDREGYDDAVKAFVDAELP